MPLFVARGRMACPMIAALSSGTTTAGAERARLARMAGQCGGRLAAFHVIAGTWDLLMLFDLPIDGATRAMVPLQSGGLFEPGHFRLAITLDSGTFDQTLAACNPIASCWGQP